ncbi:MAG: intein-containing replicative DNA helicase, partial [Chloroflexi bacterium]
MTTRSGRSVEVTGHHPFLTARGWQPLHDIVVGDRIAVPRVVNCFGHDSNLDLGQVRLLAYFIAEGSLSRSSPGFTNADPDLVSDFVSQIERLYPTLRIRRYGITYYPAGPGGRTNPLTLWLRDLGLMGKLADAKRFPACIWRWDRDRLREFIKVLMSCDGTIYSMGGYPRIEFAVASEGL